jgi:hypothetical protein
MNLTRLWAFLLGAAALALPASADPLSKKTEIDFYRDSSSRGLHGLAARTDGRLVAGPALKELGGSAPAQLLWSLEPQTASRWLVGTGPDGKIFEITVDAAASTFSAREVAKLEDTHIFALKALGEGSILAGTSPHGGLVLLTAGKTVAKVRLPVDSIFDLEDAGNCTWLVGTGNPGRIYSIDLAKFRAAGISSSAIDDEKSLARHGIALFGSIVDRNVRRLAKLTDGNWAVGSAPRGNVYRFGPRGGAPRLLEENQKAEVTDLMARPNGEFVATIIFSGTELRLGGEGPKATAAAAAAAAGPAASTLMGPVPEEKFAGRSILVRFPADGFPDILTARSGGAYYQLARHDDVLVIAGGEQGDISGYDLTAQQAMNFGGSVGARLSTIAAVPQSASQYLIAHNNAPGFALMDFGGAGPRSVETRSLDLGQQAQIGAVRFDRLKAMTDSKLKVEIKLSSGAEEREGWSPWTVLDSSGDGWRGSNLRGRYYKLRISLPAETVEAQLGRAAIYYLPQNRRPVLQEFHFLTPNYGILPPAESVPAVTTTLSQVISVREEKDKSKEHLMAATVFPASGNETAFWTVTSPTGDNLLSTLSIRREGDTRWTDIAVDTKDSYAQFDLSHLPEGVYYTRLVTKQTAPRPEKDRLTATFETDDLVIDHTPPVIVTATVRREGGKIILTVQGKDALSLLDNLQVDFNNGLHESVEQPADGVRDGREETFIVEEPAAKAAGATSVEVALTDAAGNSSTQRIDLK